MSTIRANAIATVLKQRYTIKDGILILWPSWLSSTILLNLEKMGMAHHTFGGAACYAATFWFID